MGVKISSPSAILPTLTTQGGSASEVIDAMIELKFQAYQLDQQIKALQPLFFATCEALKTSKIELEHAVISRRVTPAQWTYDPHILQQQDFLKALKQEFQRDHEPTSGRDIIGSVKLLHSKANA